MDSFNHASKKGTSSKPFDGISNGHIDDVNSSEFNHLEIEENGQGGHFDCRDVMTMRTKEVEKEREFFLDMFQLIYQETVVKTPVGIGKGKNV